MSFNLWHIAVLLILIALTLPALIHVWLPSNLPDIGKLAWTLIIVLLLLIIGVVLALLISNGKLGGSSSAMAASIGAGEWIRQLV